jgi:hypothetical protein
MTEKTTQKRLRFDRVEVYKDEGDERRVQVVLALGERAISTSSLSEDNDRGSLRAAAEASFKAIEEACDGKFRCVLADLDHVNALGKDLIAVLVDVSFEGKQVQVFGSCQISGSEIDAAVKATLNATNRFFELAMRK